MIRKLLLTGLTAILFNTVTEAQQTNRVVAIAGGFYWDYNISGEDVTFTDTTPKTHKHLQENIILESCWQ